MNNEIHVGALIALMIIFTGNTCTATTIYALGVYVQDINASDKSAPNFYDSDVGFIFSPERSIYGPGDFKEYLIIDGDLTENETEVLLNERYNNIHCLFCHNLCLGPIPNPEHNMSEEIILNNSKIRYYEDGLVDADAEALKMAIDGNAITYAVKTDYIPMKMITNATEDDEYIDFEYRGKMMFFGEEYYVKDIDESSAVYLDKALVLENVTTSVFTGDYGGYQFKLNHLIYAAEYQVAGMVIDVKNPDEAVAQVQISKMANGVVDDLEIAGINSTDGHEPIDNVSLIIYNLSSQIVLQDGEDLTIGDTTYDNWEVSISSIGNCSQDSECDHAEYDDMTSSDNSLLKNITITYTSALSDEDALRENESLAFPGGYELKFRGYLNNNYSEAECSGVDNGNILLRKGDEAYQMVMDLTGNNSVAYSQVRLDNGPFSRHDLFIAGGEMYEYQSYTPNDDDDDSVDVTLNLNLSNSTLELNNMIKLCDADYADMTTITGADCGADVIFRKLALTYALDGDGNYDNDEDYTIDPDDIFLAANVTSFGGVHDVFFVDGKLIITDANFTDNLYDSDFTYLAVKGDLVGEFKGFEVDDYNLTLSVDTAYADTVDFLDYSSNVTFETEDGDVVIDLYSRGSIAENEDNCSNSVVFGSVALDNDLDSVLMVPAGGDTFTLAWGVNNEIESVEVCHPVERVYSTYFIGASEDSLCPLIGDEPPCGAGNVTLSEVVATIQDWVNDDTALSDVVALIHAWVLS